MKQEDLKNFVEEVWNNINWEGMEAVLYKDGSNWIRQQGSRGVDEEDVVYTLPLSFSYWSDSFFMCLDEDDEPIKDESMKEDFIEDMESQVRKELDL